MKQVPYWKPTNIWGLRTKLRRHGGLATEICASLLTYFLSTKYVAPSTIYVRCKNSGHHIDRKTNLVRCLLIFMVPQHGNCFVLPFWRRKFWKIVAPVNEAISAARLFIVIAPPPTFFGFITTHAALIRCRMVQSRINSPVFTASFILHAEIKLRTSRYKIATLVSWKITGCQRWHEIYIDPTIGRIFKTVLIHLPSPNTNSWPTRSYKQCPSYESWGFRNVCVIKNSDRFGNDDWVVLPSLSSINFFFVHLTLENEGIMFLKHVWNHSPKAHLTDWHILNIAGTECTKQTVVSFYCWILPSKCII
jgi:hypothetical protein